MVLPVERNGSGDAVSAEKIGNIVSHKLIIGSSPGNQKALAVFSFTFTNGLYNFGKVMFWANFPVEVFELFKFFNSLNQVFFLERFQQIVDTVYFESTDGIVVKSSDENHHAFHFNLIENRKAQPVSKLNVH